MFENITESEELAIMTGKKQMKEALKENEDLGFKFAGKKKPHIEIDNLINEVGEGEDALKLLKRMRKK